MPLLSKKGGKTSGLVQQHVFYEAVDSGVQTFQLEAPCTEVTLTNVYTKLSGIVAYNINGVTGNITPGGSFTYSGTAISTFTLNTTVTGKWATVNVVATEPSVAQTLSFYEYLVNGTFDKGSQGWTLIDGSWSSGKINLTAAASFKAAGYQLVAVPAGAALTLSHDGTGVTAAFDAAGVTPVLDYGAGARTFNTGANTSLRIYMGNNTLGAGTYWFDNLSLKKFV